MPQGEQKEGKIEITPEIFDKFIEIKYFSTLYLYRLMILKTQF